jgi:ribosomal protein L25 (general stress protein Ctc)
VTLIGDSVADEIAYLSSARALVGRGVRLRLEVAACRRLTELSCTVAGFRPQTALKLVRTRGRALGQVAIVAVGYNDYEHSFARDAREVLTALHRAGVQQVLWLTLRATHHAYLPMNDALRELATTTPWLTVVDWNKYSRSHPDWFKEDGLHLTHAGATAMATLLHRTLASLPRAAGSSS